MPKVVGIQNYQTIKSPDDPCDRCIKIVCEKKDGLFCWEQEDSRDTLDDDVEKNEFYDEWVRVVEGKTNWIPFFLPWN